MSFEYSFIFRAIVLMIVCAWASLLAHLGISSFNDGARLVYPEFLEGRMKRVEFALIVTGMGIGWVLAGFSQWLATGLIAIHLTLIATDCIGAWSSNKWIAVVLGAIYGAVCMFGTTLINSVFTSLPYNFLEDLTQITTPALPLFCLYPAIAIAGQFGTSPGVITGAIEAIVYIICTIVGKITIGRVGIYLYPYTFSMFIGMCCLIFIAIKKSKESDGIDYTSEEENLFTKNIKRIQSNWGYLCIQGALNALAIKILAQTYQPYVLASALEANDMSVFYLTMIGVILAFIPLIVSTSLATGVYQAVGLTTVMLVGTLAPTWFWAFVFGFVAEWIELRLLGLFGGVLSKFPELSKSSDHIRNGMMSCLTLALTVGSFLAANQTWGSVGITIVGAFYVLNEITGQKIPKMAVGPIGAVVVGVVYNIVVVLGFVI